MNHEENFDHWYNFHRSQGHRIHQRSVWDQDLQEHVVVRAECSCGGWYRRIGADL